MTRISGLSFQCILPGADASPVREMRDCLNQLQAALSSSCEQKILKLTLFLKAKDNPDFYTIKAAAYLELRDFFQEKMPAVSFVAQPPEQERQISLEATLLASSHPGTSVFYKSRNEISYTLVQCPDRKEIYAAGLTIGNRSGQVLEQSQGAFEVLVGILRAEGMDLSSIVRQWNYVEDIVGRKCDKDGERQNYQVFNDVRTTFYAKADFLHGYPSATGIGAIAGGIVLECIALSADDNLKIVPLSNPQQQDAHRYSQDVLVGKPISSVPQKTSPKFERAKLVSDDNTGLIFVAGTASIRGQITVGIGDVEAQTKTTIENIADLTSRQNLAQAGFQTESEADPFLYLRVYVKYAQDIPQVKNICEKAYGRVPILYVVSDICRDELLVEIEGAVLYPALKRL